MNQILYTENSKSKKVKGPVEIKKVVLFFSIAIILFGIVLLGQGSYAMYKQNEEKKINETIPTIQIEQKEKQAVIKVSHDKEIVQMTYQINEEQEKVIPGNGRTSLEQTIDLSVGSNDILITVIDINGKETSEQVNLEVETDLSIELAVVGNKIKITASDTQEGMNYLTYKWNNDEETRVEMTEESPNKIEVEADIPVGYNTLTINAVNQKNIIRTKEQEVRGVKKPEISAVQEDEYIVITVTDEEGLQSIEHNLNGEVLQTIDAGGQTELVYRQQLVEGDNYITVTATSTSGAETVFYGLCKNETN